MNTTATKFTWRTTQDTQTKSNLEKKKFLEPGTKKLKQQEIKQWHTRLVKMCNQYQSKIVNLDLLIDYIKIIKYSFYSTALIKLFPCYCELSQTKYAK